MSFFTLLRHECAFATRERSLKLWVMLVLVLSCVSIVGGVFEVTRQHNSITHLIKANQQEQQADAKKITGWGSTAFYRFDLTYDRPSDFAFAALGQRDEQPWKHRIRLLALEGQIYERDVGNPSLALIGRFDFAFLAAFIFPLVLIMLLYNMHTSEKTAGRWYLLEATAARSPSLWWARTLTRAGAVFISLIVPLWGGALISGTSITTLILASLSLLIYTTFWTVLCYVASTWRQTSSTILIGLISIWLCTSVVVPTAARLTIDHLVPLPSGANILLTQREAVNDAWDLPRDTTMKVFFKRHPQWANYTKQTTSFEWQWYYAFQQVGDQKTEHLTQAYRTGRLKRDHLASWASLLAPASLLERTLQSLAHTHTQASIRYEDSVRHYHRQLREFYYPYFFTNAPFDKNKLQAIPVYEPRNKPNYKP